MATVLLAKPDLALLSDPTRRVTIPHLIAAPLKRRRDVAYVRFEGDTAPTAARGEGAWDETALTCRYAADEHADLAAMQALLDEAHGAADGRLIFRTNFYAVPGLDRAQVVTAAGYDVAHVAGRVWDLRVDVTAVPFSLEV